MPYDLGLRRGVRPVLENVSGAARCWGPFSRSTTACTLVVLSHRVLTSQAIIVGSVGMIGQVVNSVKSNGLARSGRIGTQHLSCRECVMVAISRGP